MFSRDLRGVEVDTLLAMAPTKWLVKVKMTIPQWGLIESLI